MRASFADLSAPMSAPSPQMSGLGIEKNKNVARTTIVESGFMRGISIRMLQLAVNIYPLSLTTIEFPWWALTIQREKDQR